MGYISAYSMPVFVGALMAGFGISAKEIGFIASAELGGIAISSILLAGNIGRLNLRYVALLGCVIALSGHGITLAAGSLWFFVLARFLPASGKVWCLRPATEEEPQRATRTEYLRLLK